MVNLSSLYCFVCAQPVTRLDHYDSPNHAQAREELSKLLAEPELELVAELFNLERFQKRHLNKLLKLKTFLKTLYSLSHLLSVPDEPGSSAIGDQLWWDEMFEDLKTSGSFLGISFGARGEEFFLFVAKEPDENNLLLSLLVYPLGNKILLQRSLAPFDDANVFTIINEVLMEVFVSEEPRQQTTFHILSTRKENNS